MLRFYWWGKDSEPLVSVLTKRTALQRYSLNTIKVYKQYARVFLQAMLAYTSLKDIPVSEIEGLINRTVTDNKIGVSYQRSLVGTIKKFHLYYKSHPYLYFYQMQEYQDVINRQIKLNEGINIFKEETLLKLSKESLQIIVSGLPSTYLNSFL